MISNNQSKFIKSLQNKKGRMEAQAFLVEGRKNVLEVLHSSFETMLLVGTESFFSQNALPWQRWNCAVANEERIAALGTFKTNEHALAVVRMAPDLPLAPEGDEALIALDDVRDPGNLGTIVRIADWYGIRKIVASQTSAEWYNPRAIASSMGSFTRVSAWYTDLEIFLQQQSANTVYGTFLEGEDIHRTRFSLPCILLFGNESNGIHPGLASRVHHRIRIPKYGGAESLNVAIATAVVCDNLRRQQ
jgi:RNA methyltransferase, TrmH family